MISEGPNTTDLADTILEQQNSDTSSSKTSSSCSASLTHTDLQQNPGAFTHESHQRRINLESQFMQSRKSDFKQLEEEQIQETTIQGETTTNPDLQDESDDQLLYGEEAVDVVQSTIEHDQKLTEPTIFDSQTNNNSNFLPLPENQAAFQKRPQNSQNMSRSLPPRHERHEKRRGLDKQNSRNPRLQQDNSSRGQPQMALFETPYNLQQNSGSQKFASRKMQQPQESLSYENQRNLNNSASRLQNLGRSIDSRMRVVKELDQALEQTRSRQALSVPPSFQTNQSQIQNCTNSGLHQINGFQNLAQNPVNLNSVLTLQNPNQTVASNQQCLSHNFTNVLQNHPTGQENDMNLLNQQNFVLTRMTRHKNKYKQRLRNSLQILRERDQDVSNLDYEVQSLKVERNYQKMQVKQLQQQLKQAHSTVEFMQQQQKQQVIDNVPRQGSKERNESIKQVQTVSSGQTYIDTNRSNQKPLDQQNKLTFSPRNDNVTVKGTKKQRLKELEGECFAMRAENGKLTEYVQASQNELKQLKVESEADKRLNKSQLKQIESKYEVRVKELELKISELQQNHAQQQEESSLEVKAQLDITSKDLSLQRKINSNLQLKIEKLTQLKSNLENSNRDLQADRESFENQLKQKEQEHEQNIKSQKLQFAQSEQSLKRNNEQLTQLLKESQQEFKKQQVQFQKDRVHFASCLNKISVGQKRKFSGAGDVAKALEEKNRQITVLKIKNEQLREKELFARLNIDNQHDNCSYLNLKNEIQKLSQQNTDYSLAVEDLQIKLQQYEFVHDGKTREQLEQENCQLRDTLSFFAKQGVIQLQSPNLSANSKSANSKSTTFVFSPQQMLTITFRK